MRTVKNRQTGRKNTRLTTGNWGGEDPQPYIPWSIHLPWRTKDKMVDRGQAVALVSQVCLSMKGTQPFTWAYITLLLRFLNLLRYSIKPISSIIALLCYNTLFLFYPDLKVDQKKGGNRK
jgi:hypothetical protein